MKPRTLASALLVAAFSLLFVNPAVAEGDEEEHLWMERSFYVQAAGSRSREEFSGGVTGSDGLGLNLRVGIRTTPWIAFEVDFEWLDGMNPGGNGGDNWATTLNARGYPTTDLLFEGRVQPYLLVGVGASSFRSTRNREIGFASRWGGGLDLYMTEELALTFGATYLWSSGTPVKDRNYVSFSWGAMYRFY